MKNLIHTLQQTKQAASIVAKLSAKEKKQILLALAKELQANQKSILRANQLDVVAAKKTGATEAFIDRLTLTEKGFSGMLAQIETVANLTDVIGENIEQRKLSNGVIIQKKRFPLGVIAVIYESRPNVTIDVVGLCLQSGNTVILKGGSEALRTNTRLVQCVHTVLMSFGLPRATVTFLSEVTHAEIGEMLQRSDLIDVVIPRGSYGLTTAVAKQSRIPILYHAAGGARMYIDKSADLKQALEICLNAKTNRTGVCNALDMVLVHSTIVGKILPAVDKALSEKGFEIRADKAAKKHMKHALLAKKEDFETEFLDSILAVKTVDTASEAITFIKEHTNGHTEVLAAQDKEVIDTFIQEVDAAGIMINCSSRLHDGGEFGMGAEMGTATGKLHARGPVGVKELTTYKWIAYGNGQVKE
ncbi:MAG: glutamate-5-semialdehyde dehydrogenase [Patescibacteria group bacterium]